MYCSPASVSSIISCKVSFSSTLGSSYCRSSYASCTLPMLLPSQGTVCQAVPGRTRRLASRLSPHALGRASPRGVGGRKGRGHAAACAGAHPARPASLPGGRRADGGAAF
eukprot:scaffold176536_cov31-Tisochrysis_lutea.AAC.1